MAQHHLVIADTAEVNHVMSVAGTQIRVVNHVVIPAAQPVTPTLAEAIFAAVKNLWSTNLATFVAPNTFYQAVLMRDLRDAAFPLVQSTGSQAAGTAPTGQALPRQIAACLTIRTNSAGRKFRGRSYWGGFAENANGTDNHMETAFKTAIDAFAAGYMGAHAQSGCALGVAHRPTAFDEITGLPISPGLGFITAATAVVCRDSIWDTQRRRAL